MASGNVLTVLDPGSSFITAVIAQLDADGTPWVKGVRRVESTGISKGKVRDLNQVAREVDEALSGAAYSAGLHFGGVYAALKTADLRAVNLSNELDVPGESGEISRELVRRAVEGVRPATVPEGMRVVQRIVQEFEVDGEKLDGMPSGMYGSRLGVNCHVVLAPRPHLNNLEKVFEQLGSELLGFIYSPQAAGRALLGREQRQAGSLVVDFGGDLTGYALYNDGAIRHSGVLAVGSNNYDRDIMHGLSVGEEEAERLKQNYGRIWMSPDASDYDKQIDVRRYGKRMHERMSRSELVDIMNPRSEEILDLVLNEVSRSPEFERVLGEGALCGGGARLRGAGRYFGRRLDMDFSVSGVQGFSYLSEEHRGPEMVVPLGLVEEALDRGGEERSESSEPLGSGMVELLDRVNDWGLRAWEFIYDFLSGKEMR